MSKVNSPMKNEQILYPVSAQVISMVVLSSNTRNKKTRYTVSMIFAGLSKFTQSLEGNTSLKKILKTP